MVRDTTLAHKGLAPYKLSYLTVSKDAHAGHTHGVMKSGVDSDRRKLSAFWNPRHISNTLYRQRKSNRPY
jgi:hypothetical protein